MPDTAQMQRIKALLAPDGVKAGPNGAKVFTFIASTASLDRQGEVVQQGAAWKLDAYRQSPVVVDSHDYRSIENVIGKTVDLRATDHALEADIAFNSSPKGRLAEQLVEDGSVRAVSVGFMPLDFAPGKAAGDPPTHRSQELLEISLVAVGANRDAVRIAGFEDGAETRAAWDAAFINDLPDSSFAVILPGGEKDDQGKTVPRSLRKLPHHGPDGAIDLPHLRNALARLPQADLPAEAKARATAHLEAHASAEEVGTRGVETRAEPDVPAARRILQAMMGRLRDQMDSGDMMPMDMMRGMAADVQRCLDALGGQASGGRSRAAARLDDGDEPPYSAAWEALKDLALAVCLDVDGYPEGKRRALYSSLARQYRTLGRTAPDYRGADDLLALTDTETKGLFWEGEAESLPSARAKAGRVLSKKNEGLIRQAHASLTTVLEQLGEQESADEQPPKDGENGKALDVDLSALAALVAGLPGGSEA